MSNTTPSFDRGSVWRRWDPHIHAPGTVLNDQFKGQDVWDEYLARIENADPQVVALGITDYWSLDLYEEVLTKKAEGRLADVELIFPNVEVRFEVGTAAGKPINGHLLICPEDPDHLAQARGFLAKLSFEVKKETYHCTRENLIALGKAHDPNATSDQSALKVGTTQFKTTIQALNKAIAGSEWAQRNVIVAVAAGSGDGTSGLKKEASMAAIRLEIERSAEVIFSGNPGDRAFWLGEGKLSIEELRATYDGAKPCLHGSDAHRLDQVCAPPEDRYTWIKGDATFEALRQALIEPGARALVGPSPPAGALPFRIIDSIELGGAEWCSPSRIDLNPGLVGIIGARGSGKTALADLLATAAGSSEGRENERSFIRRAGNLLDEVEITLRWADGDSSVQKLAQAGGETSETPGVQYLSQQFVERLCSSDGGVSDELLVEIERVIFEEHSAEERLGVSGFGELLEKRSARSRLARDRSRQALERAVARISQERRKQAELSALRERQKNGTKIVADDRKARTALISKGTESRAKRLEEIQAELEKRQVTLDSVARRAQAIAELADRVKDIREREVDAELEDLKQAHADAGVGPSDWKAFRREFAGDVDQIVEALRKVSEKELAELRGKKLPDPGNGKAFIDEGTDLTGLPQAPLAQEAGRLRELIGIDAKKEDQLKALDKKIARAESVLSQLEKQITAAESSAGRIEALKDERKAEYGKVFDALIEEEAELTKLYAPLAKTLEGAVGALAKLSFEVRREVDVEAWAKAGEELLDLRKTGPFKGHGTLLEAAREELAPAWRTGTSENVAEAMASFRDRHDEALLEHSLVSPDQGESYWRWVDGVSTWLDGTDHIRIRYGIQYDGVDIEQLSPGTRGIVLLLLYLSIDRTDDRPLIIDQPEENLDPKSVFDELVDRFRETRARRQVIIVTHNANLVVNTDADQVIIATAGPHRSGDLPEINYEDGGLENPEIRRQVCEILEGGQQAFTERARRLRVRLPR